MRFILILIFFNCFFYTQKGLCCTSKHNRIKSQNVGKKIKTRGLGNLRELHTEFAALVLQKKNFLNTIEKIKNLKDYPIEALCEEELACLASENATRRDLKIIRKKISFLSQFYYGITFEAANYPNEDLSLIQLEHVVLKNSVMPDTKFVEANLSYSDLSFSMLQKASFFGATLKQCHFETANLSEAIFTEANLDSAILTNANISYAQLMSANLSHAKLKDCIAFKCVFMFSNMQGANLSEINAEHCNLSMVNLQNATLTFGYFKNASFLRSDLTDANLCGANFENANFSFANFTNAIFYRIKTNFIENSCIVSNANFYKAKGLNPEQKFFLIKNGALNVPE